MTKIGNLELGEFPIMLAPMENVTGPSFRLICKPYGVDMMYTEFISSEGLIRDVPKSIKKLHFDEIEQPIGIQIFGNNEESLKNAAIIAEESQPDVIDINYGCSIKKIARKGSGAGVLNDIPKMIRMTDAIVKATKLPITVKTRLGWDENNKNIVEITERLQDIGISAITIHGRTRAQIYKGDADYTLIGEVKNNPRIKIPVIGNGDITTPERALEIKDKYGLDGIMIGRASIGNPWIFKQIKHYLSTGELLPNPTTNERIKVCLEHLHKAIEMRNETVGILALKRHYHSYFPNLPNFKPLRLRLLTADNLIDIENTLEEIKNIYHI